MSWRDDYRPGSFRGVPFVTASHEFGGGRRTQVHEFPRRDDPLTEDLGRQARRFTLECFVWGEDYTAARDALIDALEAEGPGTLIHPWRGTRNVAVLDFRQSESTDEGGFAAFSIDFTEAGEAAATPASPDGKAQAITAADDVVARAPAAFAERFDVSTTPAFVEQAADDLVSGIASASQISAGLSGGAGSVLRAFDTGLRLLGVSGLLHSPLALGQAVTGLVSALSVLGTSSRKRVAALKSLAEYGDGLDPVYGATPARNQQRENQASLAHLVAVTASAEMIRAVTDLSFASYEDAIGTRDSLTDFLDARALAAADAGEDDRAADFDLLRRAMVRDVTARGGSLARLYAYSLPATQPALAIAMRLYGNAADLADLADGIVARNGVRHPGFVPGGAELKVAANV